MEGHYLLVFVTLCAMIETYHKFDVARVGPFLDEHQINNLERNAPRTAFRSSCHVGLSQIAHSPSRVSGLVAIAMRGAKYIGLIIWIIPGSRSAANLVVSIMANGVPANPANSGRPGPGIRAESARPPEIA